MHIHICMLECMVPFDEYSTDKDGRMRLDCLLTFFRCLVKLRLLYIPSTVERVMHIAKLLRASQKYNRFSMVGIIQ